MSTETQKVESGCPHCGGYCEWFTTMRNTSGFVEGRLRTGDVECVFVLGCTDCSETVEIRRADDVAASMNTALARVGGAA